MLVRGHSPGSGSNREEMEVVEVAVGYAGSFLSCRFLMRWLHLPCVRKPALLYVPALSLHGLRGGIIVDIVRGNEESDA